MEIVDPKGEIVRDDQGNPVTITLRGKNSEAARAAERKAVNRQIEAARRGRKNVNHVEDVESQNLDRLEACTVDWSFTELDGKPFPCNPANARQFWGDRRFRSIRDQAEAFIADEQNFIKG
jgi:hypothetical protein